MCISEKLNTSKLMKIATLPIVPTWDSSRTRLRLWMMQQLEWSLLSFYSFFLPSSIFGLLCQVIKHSNIHSLWPITRKNCLCIFYGSYTICSKPLINARQSISLMRLIKELCQFLVFFAQLSKAKFTSLFDGSIIHLLILKLWKFHKRCQKTGKKCSKINQWVVC